MPYKFSYYYHKDFRFTLVARKSKCCILYASFVIKRKHSVRLQHSKIFVPARNVLDYNVTRSSLFLERIARAFSMIKFFSFSHTRFEAQIRRTCERPK